MHHTSIRNAACAIGGLCAALLWPTNTSATPLIERDLLTPGDGLVTLDTLTGLEWLDLVVTRGKTQRFAESGDVTVGFPGPTTGSLGFTLASFPNLRGLLTSHGFDFDSSSGGISGSLSDVSSVNNRELYPSFVALLSETRPFVPLTGGFIDRRVGFAGDAFQTPAIRLGPSETEATVILSLANDRDTVADVGGSWLVRPTSLPKAVDAGDHTVYADTDFGHVLVGATAELDLIVANVSNDPSFLATSERTAGSADIGHGTRTIDLAVNEAESLPVTYAPGRRGGDTATVEITSAAGTDSITYNGNGVAPIGRVGTDPLPVVVRTGTVETITVEIVNTGDGNRSGLGAISNLRGSAKPISGSPAFIGSGGEFSVVDRGAQAFNYQFAPTENGAHTGAVLLAFDNGSADGTNNASSETLDFASLSVGPVFGAELNRQPIDPGDLINFGRVRSGSTTTFQLSLGNLFDEFGFPDELVGLSVLDFSFDGRDAFAFDLRGLTPGTVLGAMETLDLFLDYTPLGNNIVASATLSLFTDVGADFGSSRGEVFIFNLQGNPHTSVPEPGTLGLFGLGLAGLAFAHGLRRLLEVTGERNRSQAST